MHERKAVGIRMSIVWVSLHVEHLGKEVRGFLQASSSSPYSEGGAATFLQAVSIALNLFLIMRL